MVAVGVPVRLGEKAVDALVPAVGEAAVAVAALAVTARLIAAPGLGAPGFGAPLRALVPASESRPAERVKPALG